MSQRAVCLADILRVEIANSVAYTGSGTAQITTDRTPGYGNCRFNQAADFTHTDILSLLDRKQYQAPVTTA